MPASRLSDGQRAEMVERFRQGVATVELADAYGCSPNTVSRLVKAAMDGDEYERLKRQRQRRSGVGDPAGSEGDQPLEWASAPAAVAMPAAVAEVVAAEVVAAASEPEIEPDQIGRAHV